METIPSAKKQVYSCTGILVQLSKYHAERVPPADVILVQYQQFSHSCPISTAFHYDVAGNNNKTNNENSDIQSVLTFSFGKIKKKWSRYWLPNKKHASQWCNCKENKKYQYLWKAVSKSPLVKFLMWNQGGWTVSSAHILVAVHITATLLRDKEESTGWYCETMCLPCSHLGYEGQSHKAVKADVI